MFTSTSLTNCASSTCKGSESISIQGFCLSLNVSLPSFKALYPKFMKIIYRDVLWPRKLWYLQKPFFFLCFNGGVFRPFNTMIWPQKLEDNFFVTFGYIKCIHFCNKFLVFTWFDMFFFLFEDLKTLQTYEGHDFNSARLTSFSLTHSKTMSISWLFSFIST